MKFLMAAFLLVGCASKSTQLTDEAKILEVYTSKPGDCRVVGKVTGKDQIGSKELALNDALNQAAELNASGIFVNEEVPNGKVMNVYATAYQCD